MNNFIVKNGVGHLLTNTITINFDSSMSAADIQALIDIQPKNLNGYVLNFKFADGTYTLNNYLTFNDFFGGYVTIFGNTTEGNGPYTSQSVHLNASTWTPDGVGVYGLLNFDRCCTRSVRWLKITTPDVANACGIYDLRGTGSLYVGDMYFASVGKSNPTYGIRCYSSAQSEIVRSYFSNYSRAIHIDRSFSNINNCPGTGTDNDYGISATTGAIVTLGHATFPSWAISPFLNPASTGAIMRFYTDVTIDIDNSFSNTMVQVILDNLPKDLNGWGVFLQFADGTYNWTGRIHIREFSNGDLQLWGDTSEGTSAYTTQGVHINGSGWAGASSQGLFTFEKNSALTSVRNIKMTIPNVAETHCIFAQFNSSINISYCYFIGAAKTNANYGIGVIYNNFYFGSNYFSNMYRAIYTRRCVGVSANNISTGTGPTYGLGAYEGSTIGKSGTQPTGTTANEQSGTGGSVLA